MNQFSLKPSRGLKGTIQVPGDKSISHRSLMFGALARGPSTIKGLLLGEDVLSTMKILMELGVTFSHKPEDLTPDTLLRVDGRGLRSFEKPKNILDCGNSGTSMRLMMGLLAGQPFESILTGDDSLNRRPMDRVMQPLELMGASFRVEESNGKRLIHVLGNPTLKGMQYTLPVASAQLKSALLLAGLHASSNTTLIQPELSRDHTERMLHSMGVEIEVQNLTLTLTPPQNDLTPFKMEVPSDFSSAAFFLVAGLIVPGSDITLKSVGLNPSRRALLDVLMRMGGDIAIINERLVSGEPIADLNVRSSELKGVNLDGDIIPNLIDELPIFAVAAACAQGVSVVSDAAELRVKESDRIETLVGELSKMGAAIKEKPDGFQIEGGKAFIGGDGFQSHGDHRIAMSLAVASLIATSDTMIHDTDCVATSFPGFKNLLDELAI